MIQGRQDAGGNITREVSVDAGRVTLQGTLSLPKDVLGIVLFAHGSGSSRRSPRNQYVAGVLQSHGIATLLFDLLTAEEELLDQRTAELRFNIGLLAERLVGATQSIMRRPELKGLPVGYFGASTGAGAALAAASQLPDMIAAIVSRGGRPDLAGEALASVKAPTFLIVGGNDEPVIELNRQALAMLVCREKQLAIVRGATHLFEEAGALEEVSGLAAEWFTTHLARAARSGPHALGRPAGEDVTQARKRWEHFSHGSDIGVRGFGASVEEAFEQAATALTAVVADVSTVQQNESAEVRCDAPDIELLLVDWLNAVIYEMAVRGMLFSGFRVSISGCSLVGSIAGEKADPHRHRTAVEAKGATVTALEVRRDQGGLWSAQCVIDV